MIQMRFIVISVCFLMAVIAQGATLETKEAAKNLTNQVMAKVSAGNLEEGLFLMKPYLVIPESEFSVMIERVKLQLPTIQGRFGKAIGSEFISEKMVGKSLLQVVQIQKFERHVMRWQFIFYNPDGKWVLNNFNFDDKILSLFQE